MRHMPVNHINTDIELSERPWASFPDGPWGPPPGAPESAQTKPRRVAGACTPEPVVAPPCVSIPDGLRATGCAPRGRRSALACRARRRAGPRGTDGVHPAPGGLCPSGRARRRAGPQGTDGVRPAPGGLRPARAAVGDSTTCGLGPRRVPASRDDRMRRMRRVL